jgi:RNA polymerase sigma-70 factor (ECF subfamily)
VSFLSDLSGSGNFAQKLVQDFYESKTLDLTVNNLCRGNQIDPLDLKQNIAIKIFMGAKTFTPGTNFVAWAATICRNEFISLMRSASKRADINKAIPDYASTYGLASENLDINEGEIALQFEDIENIVKMMPDARLRESFTLVAIDGIPYDEAAKNLNLPLGSVKSSVFRARNSLKNHPIIRDAAKHCGIT